MEKRIWHRQYDPNVPADIVVPEIPLFSFIDAAAAESPEHTCIQFNHLKFNYRQVKVITDRIAANLVAMGIEKGDCIGICMPNIPQFVLLYFGALKAGCVVAAINPNFGVGEVRTMISDVKPRLIFASCEPAEVIKKMNFERTNNPYIILSPIDEVEEIADAIQQNLPCTHHPISFLAFLSFCSDAVLPTVSPEDDCIYQYSGGTTGTPKAVAAIHRNLVANTIQFRTWLTPLESGKEITLAAIPLNHVYGMVIAMCVTIALNSTILLHDERKGIAGLLQLINQEHPTLFPAVPHLLENLLQQEALKTGDIDLPWLKIIISGASSLRTSCQEAFQQLLPNGRIVQGYGLSEAPTATHCNPLQGKNLPGTIGLPLPGVDIKVVDVNHPETELPQGEIGEMFLRSPQVMRGYLNRREETNTILRDGWLATGDIVKMDEEGYFTILDRKKDLIKVNEFQVWPREIETVLSHHPLIYEAGVISAPDPIVEEKIIAWLVMEPGKTITLEETQQWCKRWLASFKTPHEIYFCDHLPRSGMGKMLRRELRKWYQEMLSGQ